MAARIYPSLLAADFAHLADSVAIVENAVDGLHVDVMDGHFVPNISFGLSVIEDLRPTTGLFFDTHLMMSNPDHYFPEFKAAGCDMVTVHIEVAPDPTAMADKARAAGLQFGITLNPPTPFEAVEPFLELVDNLLIMSVYPGFGGQSFIPEVLQKVERAREIIDSAGLATDIQIDGGITPETGRLARAAGADIFVAGTAIFGQPDPVQAVANLRAALED
ncbi:MAG: ribulose-phosphate 3-epimerase [Acidimicrobiia bacterium]|nr:ribulose-phosphate 3-epimerase [Acidimicrobiia bacterium]NNL70425.1 ribulose-phosphate 3-epimerase [Acidimicrobiia bacterium]